MLYRTHRMNQFISWDRIISYWILIWFIIYVLASKNKNTEIGKYIYENTNPWILFLLGILGNFYMLFIIFIENPKRVILITYITEIIFIKAIPIWFLFQQKRKMVENFMFSIAFVFFYLTYISFLGENVFTIYYRINQSIIKNENNTPLYFMLSRISDSVMSNSR